MIYPSVLERQYQQYLPFVQQISEKVKATMQNFCDSHQGFAFTSRIKKVDSLAEKIETGRFQKWSELNDLFACTVIIPTLLQEGEVIDFCRNTFDITKTVERGQNKKAPDIFRFDSTRIYARLKRLDTSLDTFLSIFDIIFEIQIKSAFEHAWAVSTHDLVYKSDKLDWKRLRLAAQIKSTVEQLDTLILAFEQASSIIQESKYPEIDKKCSLAVATNQLFEQKKIPEELKPKDMTRFCDNLYNILTRAKKEENIQEVIKCLKKVIHSTSTKKIPRSISLLQYFFAILVDKQVISLPIEEHHFHITEELITLYPVLQETGCSIFQYEEDLFQ
jgi:ppGpp synthetase/RelA/SpoT-type nucleotidyltranferase